MSDVFWDSTEAIKFCSTETVYWCNAIGEEEDVYQSRRMYMYMSAIKMKVRFEKVDNPKCQ